MGRKVCDSRSTTGDYIGIDFKSESLRGGEMKIAVSGATGFIGQHIVTELEKINIAPVLLVRPSSMAALQNKNRILIPLDIHEKLSDSLFKYIGEPDVLIHCAWSGLPNYQSLHHFDTELPAQYRLITTLIKNGLKNIVITGTCFEYGLYSGALDEMLLPNPNTPYGFAKNALLQQLQYFQKNNPFNLTWARLFYLYGAGQTHGALRSQIEKAIQNHEPIFHMSGGEQLRDYLLVSKVAEYLIALARLNKNFGVVNICSGRPISIRKLVETWIMENNWKIKLNLGYYPYVDHEPMAFWGDCKKLNSCLSLKEVV